jgi:hypothetical protein
MKDTHKFIKFFIAFNLLSKGKPMTNYEHFQPLFGFSKH